MKNSGRIGKSNPFRMSHDQAKFMLNIYKLTKLWVKINKGEDRDPTLEEVIEFERCINIVSDEINESKANENDK